MGNVNVPESEWCDYGDMSKVACEHCQTGQKNAGTKVGGFDVGSRPVVADSTTAVPATFNGPCAAGKACTLEGEIRKEEWITHTPGGWAHEECT